VAQGLLTSTHFDSQAMWTNCQLHVSQRQYLHHCGQCGAVIGRYAGDGTGTCACSTPWRACRWPPQRAGWTSLGDHSAIPGCIERGAVSTSGVRGPLGVRRYVMARRPGARGDPDEIEACSRGARACCRHWASAWPTLWARVKGCSGQSASSVAPTPTVRAGQVLGELGTGVFQVSAGPGGFRGPAMIAQSCRPDRPPAIYNLLAQEIN